MPLREQTARVAQPDDAAAVTELWRRFMAEEEDAEPEADAEAALPGWSARLRKQLAKGSVFVLAAGDEIVGFVGYIGSDELQFVPSGAAYIVDMYISPEHRRPGGARTLLAALMQGMAEAGWREVWTNTNVRNRRVQTLLKWWGFEPAPDLVIGGATDQLYFTRAVEPESAGGRA